MKISLVTLSFNQRAYLREAMDSVISQAFPELEYIVVDPGSTDGSRELIQSYAPHITHTIFERDKGPGDGLNKGFTRATGDVYGFLNSDDLLLPGSLQRVADFFKRNPECAMALGNGYVIDGEGRRLRHVEARDFTVRRYFYGGSKFLQQSTFFRADAFLRSPKFNVENRTCWDGELFVTMAAQGARIGYIQADLASFRLHDASISGSGRTFEQYVVDSRRLFRRFEGRDWKSTDELLRFVYRAENLLIRTRSWLQDLASRESA